MEGSSPQDASKKKSCSVWIQNCWFRCCGVILWIPRRRLWFRMSKHSTRRRATLIPSIFMAPSSLRHPLRFTRFSPLMRWITVTISSSNSMRTKSLESLIRYVCLLGSELVACVRLLLRSSSDFHRIRKLGLWSMIFLSVSHFSGIQRVQALKDPFAVDCGLYVQSWSIKRAHLVMDRLDSHLHIQRPFTGLLSVWLSILYRQ